jgi:Arc/MetJ-type ribon-helix-helix transcriptional regulator
MSDEQRPVDRTAWLQQQQREVLERIRSHRPTQREREAMARASGKAVSGGT